MILRFKVTFDTHYKYQHWMLNDCTIENAMPCLTGQVHKLGQFSKLKIPMTIYYEQNNHQRGRSSQTSKRFCKCKRDTDIDVMENPVVCITHGRSQRSEARNGHHDLVASMLRMIMDPNLIIHPILIFKCLGIKGQKKEYLGVPPTKRKG